MGKRVLVVLVLLLFMSVSFFVTGQAVKCTDKNLVCGFDSSGFPTASCIERNGRLECVNLEEEKSVGQPGVCEGEGQICGFEDNFPSKSCVRVGSGFECIGLDDDGSVGFFGKIGNWFKGFFS
ncbi:MAG: hypothetical protein ABIF88_01380 [archaeon]